jgi:hypothetical protein
MIITLCLSLNLFSTAAAFFRSLLLLDKYGIHSTRTVANKGKDHYRIRIAKASVATLPGLVAPHIGPSMR